MSSRFGLLAGLGQGIAQAGTMMATNQFDKMKEERLQRYQQQMQEKQFEREDKVRAEDREVQQTRDAQKLAFDANVQLQNQSNADRSFGLAEGSAKLQQQQFEQNKQLVSSQISRINQEIDITGMELKKQKDIQGVWNEIQKASSPEELEPLYQKYRRMTGTDKDDTFSFNAIPEFDDVGQRVGTTLLTHNERTNEIVPYSPVDTSEDRMAALRAELLGESDDPAAKNQSNVSQQQDVQQTSPGFLTPAPAAPFSEERTAINNDRDQLQQRNLQQRTERKQQNEKESFDAILRAVEHEISDPGIPGRRQPNPGAAQREIIARQNDLLMVIESRNATNEQKEKARSLLQMLN